MKKKEILKRLSAVCMSAVMSVSLLSSSVYASEELFADGADLDIADEDDASSDVDITEEDIEDGSEELSDADLDETDTEAAFSDGTDNSAEFSAGDAVGDTEPAKDATVHMTIGIRGSLAKAKDGSVMAEREVTVKDLNSDGILTYDEALMAVHDEYYEGGSAGYETGKAEDTGSLYIGKLWGISEDAYGWWKDDELCIDLQEAVHAGDELTAFVYKDTEKRSDGYTKFAKDAYTIPVGTSKYVDCYKAAYEDILDEYQFSLFRSGKLTVYDSNFQPVSEDSYTITMKDSGPVSYYISIQNTGIYYLAVESGEKENIVPSAVKVTVCVKPSFSDIKFYNSEEDYKNGAPPLEMTPEFQENVYKGYSIEAPDYMDHFYTVATLSEAAVASGNYDSVMYTNRYGGTTGVGVIDGKATPDTYVLSDGEMQLSFFNDFSVVYRVNVKRHATLKDLEVEGLMDQTFNRDQKIYHAYVENGAESVRITPSAYLNSYTIRINGTEVKSDEGYDLPCVWDVDGKMTAEVEVSTEDRIASVYSIQLERSPSESTPVILGEPEGAEYIVGDTAKALTVKASASGTLSYQWYVNEKNAASGGTAIEGADQASYTPSADQAGEDWYYCVVTNTDQTGSYQAVSATARVQTEEAPTVTASFVDAGGAMPENGHTYDWDKGFYYSVDEQAEPIQVEAKVSAEGGELSYYWRQVKSSYNSEAGGYYYGKQTSGYVPSTNLAAVNDRGSYYACEVHYNYRGHEYKTWATTGEKYTVTEGTDAGKTYDIIGVYVFVGVDGPIVPKISEQPKCAAYKLTKKIENLKIDTYLEDPNEWLPGVSYVTYQWYVNDKKSQEGAEPIKRGTKRYLDVEELGIQDSKTPGSKYYYCVVTSSVQGYTASVTSNFARIVVRRSDSQLRNLFSGSGTQEDPYLIKEASDYQKLYEAVAQGEAFEGCYFRQEADITLPEDWKPIGVTKDGTANLQNGNNLYAFSGILDGNNKTLTIPEGGRPLLGYVQNTEVRNLNIYGKKIAGYGLVNNFEGVGLSGSAIIIDNVTLKSGSSTLKAGLIGANKTASPYAGVSSGFLATIRNCTIEKDVIIGYNKDQDRIGSIAGRMQGTIENCVSYATVYGTDYVGGISGTRDNAMGECAVIGCEFYGTVEASGQHAGGIVGGGYGDDASAPNGRRITIKGCSVTGSITGVDKVGGILGADTYIVQSWNNCVYSLKGNSFTGTVKATGEKASYIGGIIGYYASLNRIDDISNNYYKAGCGAEKGIGFVRYVDTNCTEHESSSGAVYMNTEKDVSGCPPVTGCSWQIGYNRTDDPLGADASKLTTTNEIKPYEESVEISGTYRTEYEPGEDLDLTGMVIKVRMNVGSEKTVSLSDVKIEGYNKDRRGEQKVRIVCGAAYAEITVKVLKKDPEDIHVSFELLGDKKHDSDADKEYHSLRAGNLETWIPNAEYEVGGNATVLDVFEKVLTKYGYSWDNTKGNYIAGITKPDGTSLAEVDNGANSGWMYTLNGIHSDLSVTEQYLEDGDIIVFHYTDNYQQEHDHIWGSTWSSNADAHWHECTYQWSKCDITDNTKKNGYAAHTFDAGKVTKTATCREAGEKTYTCTVCGYQKKVKYTADHNYVWKTISKATVFEPEKQQGRCSMCGTVVNKDNGKKLTATIKLNATSIKLQKKQTTKKIKVTMANGDSVKSWTSSNKKIATVDKKGVIKAGKKTGTARITVTLKSGKKANLKVKVQTSKVKTTKISGLKKNVILKKGQKLALKPVISPLTSQEKVIYTSSNKKVATVSKRGTITAKKKGTVKITVRSGRKSYVVKVKVR